jgi:hypothetical protein
MEIDKKKFNKVILINVSAGLIYGVIICPIITVIFYVLSGIGPVSAEHGFVEGLYSAVKLGLAAGAAFGLMLAIILGILFRPYKRVIYTRDENIFLSKMNIALDRINYELEKRDNNIYIFKEKRDRFARILVRIRDNDAVIHGHFNKVIFLSRYLTGSLKK